MKVDVDKKEKLLQLLDQLDRVWNLLCDNLNTRNDAKWQVWHSDRWLKEEGITKEEIDRRTKRLKKVVSEKERELPKILLSKKQIHQKFSQIHLTDLLNEKDGIKIVSIDKIIILSSVHDPSVGCVVNNVCQAPRVRDSVTIKIPLTPACIGEVGIKMAQKLSKKSLRKILLACEQMGIRELFLLKEADRRALENIRKRLHVQLKIRWAVDRKKHLVIETSHLKFR